MLLDLPHRRHERSQTQKAIQYEDDVTKDPYADIVSTELVKKGLNCSEIHDRVKIKKTTSGSSYMIDLHYSPSEIKFGCDIDWIINFRSPYDETDFLYQVQYDIWVEDPTSKEIVKSLAADEGAKFLYSFIRSIFCLIALVGTEAPKDYPHYLKH